jgi:hypothetical protein
MFAVHVSTTQALMQMGVDVGTLAGVEEDERLREEIIMRMKKRKNTINKYYEINVIMIGRFL